MNLEPDTLHLVSILLTDVELQVKYRNKLDQIFNPDIGSPQGDCASPIWFIFYLHKALKTTRSVSPRNVEQDIQHDHNYTKADKKVKVKKAQKACSIDQQCADDIPWITTSKTTTDTIKESIPPILTDRNFIVNKEKTEDYSINICIDCPREHQPG